MISWFPSREVVVSIVGYGIHWYGIMYFLAFVTVLALIPRLQKYRSLQLTHETITSIVTWAIGGVILGGRLGYVFLYEASYFIDHPMQIFAVWHGGMSSHGGFLGVTIAVLYALKKHNVPVLPFLDVACVPIAIGLAFGRLGNFINLELYGTITTLPWAIEIPGVDGLRHPTQIYAIIKDCSLALICYAALRNARLPAGIGFSIFLILYAVFRSIVEIYRVQTHPDISLFGLTMTRGQCYSLPVLLIGFILLIHLRLKESS